MHAMKKYFKSHSFLTSALGGDQLQALHPDCFTPGETGPLPTQDAARNQCLHHTDLFQHCIIMRK